jgi:hypothetical protein
MAKRKKKIPEKQEGNQFDKILKENAREIFLPLIEMRMGVKIKKFQPLPTKFQTTIEREMDSFYKVETETGEKFILNLEFQTDDEPLMVYRIGEYHGIAQRLYKMEIKHFVVYLGTKKPQMATELKPEEIYKGFELINAQELDSENLLTSDIPQVILLAVLGNYPAEKTEQILRSVIRKLQIVCTDKAQFSKFIKQLIAISRLRKIDFLTHKIATEMPISFDITTDFLYLEGQQKGRVEGEQKKDRNFVSSLIVNTDFDNEKIAFLANVSLDFVEKIRKELVAESIENKSISENSADENSTKLDDTNLENPQN